MKNIIISFTLLLLFSTMAAAQFKAGESFISGGFSNNLSRFKQTSNNEAVFSQYSHNINVSFGKFAQNNKAFGWGLTHSLILDKYRQLDILPEPLKEIGFGIERFAEYYKPLNDKFALFIRPSTSLGYTLKNSYEAANDVVYYETKSNNVVLGISLSAGVTWRISPKWALYGYLAFINPINVSYGIENIEYYRQQTPNGGNVKSKGSVFNYKLANNLSSGSIGLGFRYFYGTK